MQELKLKYRGWWNAINPQPKEEEWIELFASDWLKDHWAFYAYIRLSHYEEDITAINALIRHLNWRDGDVYVELINHSDGLAELYHVLYREGSKYAHWNALDPKDWLKHQHLFPVSA